MLTYMQINKHIGCIMSGKKDLLEKFMDYLVGLGLQPGREIESEIKLADDFGVSRGAMREIIMHLSHLGILERVRNRGTFIRDFTCEKLEEIMFFCFQFSGFSFDELKEARLTMETAIIPLLIKRITPQHGESLRDNIRLMRDAVNEPEKADKLDREFHIMLFSICGNRALMIFSNVFHLLFRRQYREKFLNPDAVLKSVNDHQALTAAIIGGDAAATTEIIRNHILPT